jgi:Rieske 2Fe-2S family protein
MPAPIDPGELAPALRPFGESSMLPGVAYTCPEVFAWEQRHFFAGSWMCLGRVGSLPPQSALLAGDVSVIVTYDGRPRAFANVCRHRAHELLPIGDTCAKPALVCPYHGWSYGLDGALRTAPRAEVPKDLFGLVELPCADWHGWLFVNASGDGEPFAEHLGTLDELVRPYAPAGLAVKASHSYEVAANWKVIAENYHECYHCPLIHPELCAVSPPNSGNNWHEPGNWVGGSMDLREHAETMSHDGRSHGVMLPGAPSRTVRYVGLFPNLLISLHPDYVMTHRFVPLAPDRTQVECSWLFDPAVTDPSYAVDFWDLVNRQDWAACESVQRGVSSPHYRPGPLAPNENAVYDWVSLITRGYGKPSSRHLP